MAARREWHDRLGHGRDPLPVGRAPEFPVRSAADLRGYRAPRRSWGWRVLGPDLFHNREGGFRVRPAPRDCPGLAGADREFGGIPGKKSPPERRAGKVGGGIPGLFSAADEEEGGREKTKKRGAGLGNGGGEGIGGILPDQIGMGAAEARIVEVHRVRRDKVGDIGDVPSSVIGLGDGVVAASAGIGEAEGDPSSARRVLGVAPPRGGGVEAEGRTYEESGRKCHRISLGDEKAEIGVGIGESDTHERSNLNGPGCDRGRSGGIIDSGTCGSGGRILEVPLNRSGVEGEAKSYEGDTSGKILHGGLQRYGGVE